ncbi:MAG: sugar ABC transporter substrate-binding protein, partial [Clostridia bacterium]|nr:sugar ABC transporter substrate-binding protein [Clostridia bacterium]
MKLRKITALLTCTVMAASMLAGCAGGSTTTAPAADAGTEGEAAEATTEASNGEIIEFDAFFAMPATVERNEQNDVREIIAEKVGAKVKETWLTGQTD